MNIIKSLINKPKKVINEPYSQNVMSDEEILEQGFIIAKRILSRNITI
ncbi:hypothetical protein JJB46_09125 [Clostridium perfringens]|nr:hypothetical protein [Clostridium perfringens]MBO3388427.1 hypothetical protein [Clostridium perfringens]MBO3414857.1 hypothetical protein [Clostridium perfringens]